MGDRFYGYAAQNNNLNSNLNNGSDEGRDFKINNLIVSARVVDIVLDETHPFFKEVGEWNGLGTIVYDTDLSNPPTFVMGNFAKPLYPNTKNYPLINEIVFLLSLPNTQIGNIISSIPAFFTFAKNLFFIDGNPSSKFKNLHLFSICKPCSHSHIFTSPTNGSIQTISVFIPLLFTTCAVLKAEPPVMEPISNQKVGLWLSKTFSITP